MQNAKHIYLIIECFAIATEEQKSKNMVKSIETRKENGKSKILFIKWFNGIGKEQPFGSRLSPATYMYSHENGWMWCGLFLFEEKKVFTFLSSSHEQQYILPSIAVRLLLNGYYLIKISLRVMVNEADANPEMKAFLIKKIKKKRKNLLNPPTLVFSIPIDCIPTFIIDFIQIKCIFVVSNDPQHTNAHESHFVFCHHQHGTLNLYL